ncbi:unnamed protein product [Amoebophrya sp. A25]|nr:unnamed protein product [Amoebophrya sp. A25]|eukprot:GSA25T00008128001.1
MLTGAVARRAGLIGRSRIRFGGKKPGVYMGPVFPGLMQFASPLPKVPAEFGAWEHDKLCPETKEVVFPWRMAQHEVYLTPWWIDFGRWVMFSVTLWGSMWYYNYRFLSVNPPNPPRSKADDYAHRPTVHPHAEKDDD